MNGTVVSIPFRAGMDEKVDPRQAPPGTLTSLKNGVFSRTGEIRKRQGTTALTAMAGGVTAKRIFTRGDDLCAIGSDGYVWSYNLSAAAWIQHDLAPEWSASWSYPVDTMSSVSCPSVAYYGGLAVLSWCGGWQTSAPAEVYVSIIEVATGARVMPITKVASQGKHPRLVITSAGVCVLGWVDGAGSPADLKVVSVSLTAFTVSAATTLVAGDLTGYGAGFEPTWDMEAATATRITAVYCSATVGAYMKVLRFKSVGFAVSGPQTLPWAGVHVAGISVSTFGEEYAHYSWVSNANFYSAVWDVGGAAEVLYTGPAQDPTLPTRETAILALSATAHYVVFGKESAVHVVAGAASGNAVACDGVPVSKPFISGSRVYCLFAVQRLRDYAGGASFLQADSVMLAELPFPNTSGATLPALPAGNLGMRLAGEQYMFASAVARVSANEWLLVSTVTTDTSSAQMRQTLQLSHLKKDDAARWKAAPCLALSMLSGAVPTWFDGATVGDVGFVGSLPTLTGGAGGTFAAPNVLLMAVCAERRDAQGILHRGPPYQTSYTLLLAETSVVLVVNHLALTSKQKSLNASATGGLASAPYLAVFSSDANGSLLYRLSAEPDFRSIVNNPSRTTGTITHTGTLPSGTRKLLYTTGGVLEDVAPPTFRDVVVHRNRLWAISGDLRTVWFSKAMSDNPQVFPGFNETLTLRVDDGGDLVALASQDAVLLILTTKGIFYVEGDGPPATGLGSDLAPPRRVNVDVGCLDARSVVSTSLGTFFQGTDSRIYLLTRGMELQRIAAPVEETLASFPVVTSAVIVPEHDHVRFTCTTTAGTTGVTLVYDLVAGQWSRFEYNDGTASCAATSAVMWRGSYVFSTYDGKVLQESAASWLDLGTTWVSLQIETAWITTAGAQAFQRVRRVQVLGEYVTAHGFTVEQSVDFKTTYPQTTTFLEAAVLVNRDRATVHLGAQNGMNPRCAAYRARITDTAPAVLGTGEGARWSGIGLEIVPKTGLGRHGAASAKG